MILSEHLNNFEQGLINEKKTEDNFDKSNPVYMSLLEKADKVDTKLCKTSLDKTALYESALKEALNNEFPDKHWSEITDCDIRATLLESGNDLDKTARRIVESLKVKQEKETVKKETGALKENMRKKSLKEAKDREVDRRAFASLIKYGVRDPKGNYAILNDGNFVKAFWADSDEEAKEIFSKWSSRKSESIKEDVYKEWKPNTNWSHLKDIMKKVADRGYKYENNEREEIMSALDLADKKQKFKPEQRKELRDFHEKVWRKGRTSNESLKEDWYHFSYLSGGNPYIAKDEKERDRILKKYKGRVEEVKPGFYEIDDIYDYSWKSIKRKQEDESLKESAEWKYTLSCSDDLESAIDSGDLEEVVEALRGAYDELVDQELLDEGRRDKVVSALEQIDVYDDGAEAKVEKKLDQFYNVCDKLGVKISFNESLDETWAEIRDGKPSFFYGNERDAKQGAFWSRYGDAQYGMGSHTYEVKQVEGDPELEKALDRYNKTGRMSESLKEGKSSKRINELFGIGKKKKGKDNSSSSSNKSLDKSTLISKLGKELGVDNQNLSIAFKFISNDKGMDALENAMKNGEYSKIKGWVQQSLTKMQDYNRIDSKLKSQDEQSKKKEQERQKSYNSKTWRGGHDPKAPTSGKYNRDGSWQYESLKEDTVKQGSSWVNKGKEGTHGKFKTKKGADAQRKAMFANGYKEGLNEGRFDYRTYPLYSFEFKDGLTVIAPDEEEAVAKHDDVVKNMHKGSPRSKEELDKIAYDLYDNSDQHSFNYFSDEELAILWSMCMTTPDNHWGRAYDDEVYEAISNRANGKEIFAKAEEYLDSPKNESCKSRRKGKKLTEAPIYDLTPQYDSRKSFYSKAKVDTGDKGDKNRLYSYNTLVAEIKNGKPVVYGTYSATTLRHIKDWLRQNGFKADSSKQIMADYGTKDESLKEGKKLTEAQSKTYYNKDDVLRVVSGSTKSRLTKVINTQKQKYGNDMEVSVRIESPYKAYLEYGEGGADYTLSRDGRWEHDYGYIKIDSSLANAIISSVYKDAGVSQEVKNESFKSKGGKKSLNEGTSNFWSMKGLPLLVFYTMDEALQLSDEYVGQELSDPKYDGMDEDQLEEIRDDLDEKFWDELEVCVLDEEELSRLQKDIEEHNDAMLDKYNYEAEDGEAFDPEKVELKPGYYSAAQMYCNDRYCDEQEFNDHLDFFEEMKNKYALTELEVAYRFSNGETGYSKK